MSWRLNRRTLRLLICLGLLGFLTLSAGGLPSPAHAATSFPMIKETTTGPSVVGRTLTAQYTITGSGGPAEAANGTTVGNITYNATLSGNNVTSALIAPPEGILVNGSAIIRFTAPNVTEVVTIHVELTSGYGNNNVSANFTSQVRVVPPYVLGGLLVAGPTTVTGFNMTVTLDGVPVGTVVVPTIQANGSYRFSYDYVPVSLAAGWHTIAISLTPEHGLVTFQGGVEQESLQFYIESAPPDYALDVAIGIAAFAVAVFIWGSIVGARRRGRRPRPPS
jgi:hypothetical protein